MLPVQTGKASLRKNLRLHPHATTALRQPRCETTRLPEDTAGSHYMKSPEQKAVRAFVVYAIRAKATQQKTFTK
jgi:hypothetical protein